MSCCSDDKPVVDCDAIIAAAERLTECECKEPGYCPKIGCTLNEYGFHLCKTRPQYHKLWVSVGGAPCMEGPPGAVPTATGLGLGTVLKWIAFVLTLGYIKPCVSCQSRMAWLNAHCQLWPWKCPR